MPPEVFHRGIFADLPGKERQRKKIKENGDLKNGKRKVEN